MCVRALARVCVYGGGGRSRGGKGGKGGKGGGGGSKFGEFFDNVIIECPHIAHTCFSISVLSSSFIFFLKTNPAKYLLTF